MSDGYASYFADEDTVDESSDPTASTTLADDIDYNQTMSTAYSIVMDDDDDDHQGDVDLSSSDGNPSSEGASNPMTSVTTPGTFQSGYSDYAFQDEGDGPSNSTQTHHEAPSSSTIPTGVPCDGKADIATTFLTAPLGTSSRTLSSGEVMLSNSNWQEMFEEVLSLPLPNVNKTNATMSPKDTRRVIEAKLTRLIHLRALFNAFCIEARAIGKKIVEESTLPVSQRSYQPLSGYGIAGGEKYCVNNMFIKLTRDVAGIYGGDEGAVKAAKHEIRSLQELIKCEIPGLLFPMIVIVDYLGLRLVFTSLISNLNDKTLAYGSQDAGRHVVSSNPELNAKIRSACLKLGLGAHNAISTSNSIGQLMYGPVDLEGHVVKCQVPKSHLNTETNQGQTIGGNGDENETVEVNKYYLLDFARLMPPEAPTATPDEAITYYQYIPWHGDRSGTEMFYKTGLDVKFADIVKSSLLYKDEPGATKDISFEITSRETSFMPDNTYKKTTVSTSDGQLVYNASPETKIFRPFNFRATVLLRNNLGGVGVAGPYPTVNPSPDDDGPCIYGSAFVVQDTGRVFFRLLRPELVKMAADHERDTLEAMRENVIGMKMRKSSNTTNNNNDNVNEDDGNGSDDDTSGLTHVVDMGNHSRITLEQALGSGVPMRVQGLSHADVAAAAIEGTVNPLEISSNNHNHDDDDYDDVDGEGDGQDANDGEKKEKGITKSRLDLTSEEVAVKDSALIEDDAYIRGLSTPADLLDSTALLSSDCFTGFGFCKKDSDTVCRRYRCPHASALHHARLEAITMTMIPDAYVPFRYNHRGAREKLKGSNLMNFNGRVAHFAKQLESRRIAPTDGDMLVKLLHKEGINCRYLGLVYSLLKDKYMKRFILMEIIARTARSLLTSKLRSATIQATANNSNNNGITATTNTTTSAYNTSNNSGGSSSSSSSNSSSDSAYVDPSELEEKCIGNNGKSNNNNDNNNNNNNNNDNNNTSINTSSGPSPPSLPLLDVLKSECASFFNLLLGSTPESAQFWYKYVQRNVVRKFPGIVPKHIVTLIVTNQFDMRVEFDEDVEVLTKTFEKSLNKKTEAHTEINKFALFMRLQRLTGVKFTDSCIKDLLIAGTKVWDRVHDDASKDAPGPLCSTDVADIEPQSKSLSFEDDIYSCLTTLAQLDMEEGQGKEAVIHDSNNNYDNTTSTTNPHNNLNDNNNGHATPPSSSGVQLLTSAPISTADMVQEQYYHRIVEALGPSDPEAIRLALKLGVSGIQCLAPLLVTGSSNSSGGGGGGGSGSSNSNGDSNNSIGYLLNDPSSSPSVVSSDPRLNVYDTGTVSLRQSTFFTNVEATLNACAEAVSLAQATLGSYHPITINGLGTLGEMYMLCVVALGPLTATDELDDGDSITEQKTSDNGSTTSSSSSNDSNSSNTNPTNAVRQQFFDAAVAYIQRSLQHSRRILGLHPAQGKLCAFIGRLLLLKAATLEARVRRNEALLLDTTTNSSTFVESRPRTTSACITSMSTATATTTNTNNSGNRVAEDWSIMFSRSNVPTSSPLSNSSSALGTLHPSSSTTSIAERNEYIIAQILSLRQKAAAFLNKAHNLFAAFFGDQVASSMGPVVTMSQAQSTATALVNMALSLKPLVTATRRQHDLAHKIHRDALAAAAVELGSEISAAPGGPKITYGSSHNNSGTSLVESKSGLTKTDSTNSGSGDADDDDDDTLFYMDINDKPDPSTFKLVSTPTLAEATQQLQVVSQRRDRVDLLYSRLQLALSILEDMEGLPRGHYGGSLFDITDTDVSTSSSPSSSSSGLPTSSSPLASATSPSLLGDPDALYPLQGKGNWVFGPCLRTNIPKFLNPPPTFHRTPEFLAFAAAAASPYRALGVAGSTLRLYIWSLTPPIARVLCELGRDVASGPAIIMPLVVAEEADTDKVNASILTGSGGTSSSHPELNNGMTDEDTDYYRKSHEVYRAVFGSQYQNRKPKLYQLLLQVAAAGRHLIRIQYTPPLSPSTIKEVYESKIDTQKSLLQPTLLTIPLRVVPMGVSVCKTSVIHMAALSTGIKAGEEGIVVIDLGDMCANPIGPYRRVPPKYSMMDNGYPSKLPPGYNECAPYYPKYHVNQVIAAYRVTGPISRGLSLTRKVSPAGHTAIAIRSTVPGEYRIGLTLDHVPLPNSPINVKVAALPGRTPCGRTIPTFDLNLSASMCIRCSQKFLGKCFRCEGRIYHARDAYTARVCRVCQGSQTFKCILCKSMLPPSSPTCVVCADCNQPDQGFVKCMMTK